MKMTKIAFWRKVKENIEQGNYGCIMIKCERNMDNGGEMCPLDFDSPDCLICRRSHSSKKTLALAKAYIKRHESKSKKKDHILDTTKKVEEPKPIKTVGIDNSDVTLAQYEPTVKENLSVPQPIKFEDEVPEYVYVVKEDGIRFYNFIECVLKKRKTLTSSTDEFLVYVRNPHTRDTLWIDARECYRTPEEALQVAKKLWNGEGR